ncbi:hypothetical protein ABVK25_009103 [Lepraria finkii]|uniref:J domain-containing protein n=1 Tax=Lepraria finkii TaxID=1340010 RepID=A0ABR4AZ62_9LECA
MKADADRDLYKDLELEPSADANEIKRQFKKLALKYHPDRNPGKELEYNSKFQAIQSANEVLTDPQQRAKYDAHRIRAGLLHTYNATSPPSAKPNVPPRPSSTVFPPPPRPPPAAAPKSQYPPPPSGAQKYARFNRPESVSTWASAGTDSAKAKTNDYKAWEQMRHGQGPLPTRRTMPPKAARASTFQPGREFNERVPRSTTRGRADYDQYPGVSAGMPGMAGTKTSRSPKRPGFAPGTPGADEGQAPSAYFNVSRGERPASSRAQTNMPPPPSPAPTKKNHDPLQGFREKVVFNEPFGNKTRSTPYKTGGGERTHFASPELHRSATSAVPRDTNSRSNSRTGLYETPHARAASAAGANHNGKSSPDKIQKNAFGGCSSSSSSSSSSDDDEPSFASTKPYTTQAPKTRKSRMPAGAHRQTGFNPFARGKDAGDEPMAPQTALGDNYYTGPRRHSAIDLDSQKSSGFEEHRAQHDAERSRQQSTGDAGKIPETLRTDGSQPSLARSKSWQEKWEGHREKWGSPPKDNECHPAMDGQKNRIPVYAAQGFNFPDSTKRPSTGTPPIRSRSTENIDTNFSPDGYQPKFFEPSPTSRTGTPLRAVSPTDDSTVRQEPQVTGNGHNVHEGSSKTSNTTIPPPPPPAHGSYSPERWAAHLEDLNFEMQDPAQGRSRSKTTARKRLRTQAPKAANAQATVSDAEEEPTANSATGERLDSSKANRDVDAMDLDEPTPPRASATASEQQTNGNAMSPKQTNSTNTTPRQAPKLPLRANGYLQPEADALHLNLGDLKNVFPLAPSNEGLGNMNDMATTLPFESCASPTKPSADTPALRHGLPHPPKFPFTPRNLTSSTCEHYLRQLRSYMDAWNGFNTDMVKLLAKRQAFIQESSNCNWLDIRGNGYEDYMKGLEEHKRARVHLETAYDHHEKNMKDLGLVRDEIIRGRGGAGRKSSDVGDMLEALL